MPMSRRSAGSFDTSRPSKRMRPSSAVSNPAMHLSVVVLPQPDGPSSETNDPLSTSSAMPSTAAARP